MKNIALVGCAHIHTPGFVERLLKRTDIKVSAVWDHRRDCAATNAVKLNAHLLELDAIWADPSIEGVVICSETNRHEELVLAAAAAGKHMFVEKPLGFAAKDALAMSAAIEQAGVIFQTGYFMRGSPAHLFLKSSLAKGWFGRVTRVRHSNCHAGSFKGYFDSEWRWMANPDIAGCGAFGDMGTHSLDILMWLFGDRVERVAAFMQSVTGRYGDCDESGEGMLLFPGGIVATLAAGWVDQANPVQLLISGTEGIATVVNNQLYFQSVHVEGSDITKPWEKLPGSAPHAFELFLDALVGKQLALPLVTVREAAARSVVMEALYQAANSGNWVDLP